MAHDMEFEIVFAERTHSWGFGYFCPQTEESEENHKFDYIQVNLRRPDGKFWGIADVAFITAHEIRHAMHYRDSETFNDFRVYYERMNVMKVSELLGIPELRPYYQRIGLAAERDCDEFAKDYIDKHFPDYPSLLRNRVYPEWRVRPDFTIDEVRYQRELVDLMYMDRDNYKARTGLKVYTGVNEGF